MRVVIIASLVWTVGCNQLYALDETALDDADPDGDGIVQGDNCLTTKNSDQADADGDGVGDACDGCPFLPGADDHDEDGDRRADACDVCPGVADFNLDGDGDGLGDACDSATTSARVGFDAFTHLDDAWTADRTMWRLVGDAIAPELPLDATEHGITHPAFAVDGADWWVRAGFTARARWQTADTFGIVVRGSGAGDASCLISACGAAGCTLTLTVPGLAPVVRMGVDPVPLARMLFAISIGTSSAPEAVCKLEGSPASVMLSDPTLKLSGQIQLLATPDVPLAFIDVAQ